MVTYNDYLRIAEKTPENIMEFVFRAISQHKDTELYLDALIAEEYDQHRNTTINEYQKLLYTITGKAVPDNYSANFKLASNFFDIIVTQENQYLLGNGVNWINKETPAKVGDDFDYQLQRAGRAALVGGVSFGFFNLDHMDVFRVTEFAPLYEEENGALMSGVRFWQVDESKPLRATFYEPDGYTDFIWCTNEDDVLDDKWQKIGEGKGMIPKRKYILKLRTTEIDGTEIYDGENYPAFPIVPLWGNMHRQSEFTGLREQIDCYDLIKSGFANTVDEGSIIYWLIQNAGGMDDIDLVQFVERIKTMHAAAVGDGSDGTHAEPHTVEPPYQSRETLLNRLRADLFEDAMALDTKNLADGAITATQIRAAYEPLNEKTDQFEYCVLKFINDILRLAGIEDEKPSFTRSKIVNQTEEVQTLVMAAEFLGSEYVTRKVLEIFGDGDKADEVIQNMMSAEAAMNGWAEDEEDAFGEEGEVELFDEGEDPFVDTSEDEADEDEQAEDEDGAKAFEQIIEKLKKLIKELG